MRSILVSILILLTQVLVAQTNQIDQPIKNFEKLWSEFNQRYANFELKKVDWQKVYKRYRPQVTEHTSNATLFEICCQMLQELNDGHVTITPNFEEEEIECGPPYEFQLDQAYPTEQDWQAFREAMNQTFQKHGFSSPIKFQLNEETNLQYRLSNTLAYLRLDEMTEAITFGKFGRFLDEIFLAFQDKQAIIIDLRFNGGGWDKNAYTLAGKLIKNQTLHHYERTRIKGKMGYTEMKERKVKPKGKYQYTDPVYILTSDFTASAAEVFLLILEDRPQLTLVGDHTEGIFSDMYEFRLPNKWEVSLSHQQYFSSTKTNYEGKGIRPDIQVINTQKDLREGKDIVLERTLEAIKEK